MDARKSLSGVGPLRQALRTARQISEPFLLLQRKSHMVPKPLIVTTVAGAV